MYDISWSIVAAFTQCLANQENIDHSQFIALALSIENQAMNNESQDDYHRIFLLANIVRILDPVLAFQGGMEEEGRNRVMNKSRYVALS